MLRKQRGITFLGWLLLLLPLVILAYAGLRVAPIYLNYFKVARSLSQASDGLKGEETLTKLSIQNALAKRWDIESIEYPKVNDIGIQKIDGKWAMQANYEDLAPLFAGISILVKFDKTVLIGS
jgi:hypothetical protein